MSHQHKIHTDEELRELTIAVYDCKAFTSLQCKEYEITSCFLVTMFLLSPPDPPSLPDKSEDIKIDRMNKLNHIKDMVHYNEVTLPDWEKNERPLIEAFINDTGMVYEFYGKELPRAVNGKPMFMSAHFLSKSDTKRFLEIYGRYELKRAKFDKEAF